MMVADLDKMGPFLEPDDRCMQGIQLPLEKWHGNFCQNFLVATDFKHLFHLIFEVLCPLCPFCWAHPDTSVRWSFKVGLLFFGYIYIYVFNGKIPPMRKMTPSPMRFYFASF